VQVDSLAVNGCTAPHALAFIRSLRRVIARRGHVTLREGDLGGGLAGFSQHDTTTAAVDYRLPEPEWIATVVHECAHLAEGPVAPELVAAEETRACREAAAVLFPIGPQLATLPRAYSVDELEEFSARYGAPADVVLDSISLTELPIPWQRVTIDDLPRQRVAS
jgi:hypothetical protein